jgi:hypothetical protein
MKRLRDGGTPHAKSVSLIGFFLRAIVGLMLLVPRLPAQETAMPASSLLPADTSVSFVQLIATEQGLPEITATPLSGTFWTITASG